VAVLEVQGLYAGYGDSEVLHDVSATVAEQEVVTIIGPNGAGKSTLLKAIMGYLIPHQGRIVLNGQDVTRLQPHQRIHLGVAYVPQLDNVFSTLSVEENLRMGAYTLPKKLTKKRAEAQYERFPRLAERRHQQAQTMSGGERQMLAMARALMTEPKLLLLDEPSAALSPALVEQVFDKVKEIQSQGRAVLIVEQNAESSLWISDRCMVLVDGQNAFEDRADRVLSDSKLRAAYLGTAKA
jgi:ABC-type branched-subunit amino acid transport system ATPase component